MKEFFVFLALVFVFVVLWFPFWLVSFIRSKRAQLVSGRFYQIKYNPFLDRYTIGGKVVRPGQDVCCCFPVSEDIGFVYLLDYPNNTIRFSPTFFGWRTELYHPSRGWEVLKHFSPVGMYARFIDYDLLSDDEEMEV